MERLIDTQVTTGWITDKVPQNRRVFVGNVLPPGIDEYRPKQYNSNTVISSKYTVLNFIPKNLFEQFRRIANFYFLFIGLIQLVIDTPVTPATSILPLFFVIFTTAVKQGYEDWQRHRMDEEVNYYLTLVMRDGGVARIPAMQIEVGDIVKVCANEGFPCDLVMLASSEKDGTCTITTVNLDGETNLKTLYSTPDTKEYRYAEEFDSLEAVIECQQPEADLYTFVGNITVTKEGSSTVRPIGPENLLLRGARLKHTKYIYGCAVYTGQETKMAINSKSKNTKFSRVEKSMNHFLLVFLALLLVQAASATICKYTSPHSLYIKKFNTGSILGYFKKTTTVFEQFLEFTVLLNYIIPISLYVTVEIQKFVGSMFFNWDNELYDESTGEPAKANTSDLNEELGQVEYLFSDKTGTLTQNCMEFRQCSINGIKYEEINNLLYKIDGSKGEPELVQIITPVMEDFFVVLAICHTVRLDYGFDQSSPPRKDKKKGRRSSKTSLRTEYSSRLIQTGDKFVYQASSPDEKALIEACRRYGITYYGMKDDYMEVRFITQTRRYRLLHMLEFDATRKRMSLIVQNDKDDIYLLCKGAETAVLERVTSGPKAVTLKHVDDYAMLGLRTLVIANRKLSHEEYDVIHQKISEASTSIQNRQKKLEEAFDFVENDLALLGATAVEDKLQEYVPQSFISLREAGIKVWVLTGDKAETAVNISHSAGHFESHMVELWVTNAETSTGCADKINQHLQTIKTNKKKVHVLVIDGHSLTFALTDHKAVLLALCLSCSSVLCCRMSPAQKAEIVHMIKTSDEKPVTAAIGDGANDVSMIQEAHVGLGIMGKEGRQASICSDYAFAKFHFVVRALLVHGHFYYIRVANLVQYFFYKNIVFMSPQFYFIFYSGYSSQAIYDGMFLVFYNLTFTSLPILIYGIFEQHISQDTLLQHPELYRNIAKNKLLNWKHFLLWTIAGVWHSLVSYFGVFYFMGNDTFVHSDGMMVGMWSLGSMTFIIVVVVVNLKLALRTYYWGGLTFMSYIATLAIFTVTTFICSNIKWPKIFLSSQALYGVISNLIVSPNIWLVIVILTMICLFPDYIFRTFTDIYFVKQEDKRKLTEAQDDSQKKSRIVKGQVSASQTNLISKTSKNATRSPSVSSLHTSRYLVRSPSIASGSSRDFTPHLARRSSKSSLYSRTSLGRTSITEDVLEVDITDPLPSDTETTDPTELLTKRPPKPS